MSGITLYAPNELVMSARAGTKLTEIEETLAAQNQKLVAEPCTSWRSSWWCFFSFSGVGWSLAADAGR